MSEYFRFSLSVSNSRRHFKVVFIFWATKLVEHVFSWGKPCTDKRWSLLLIFYFLNSHQSTVTVLTFWSCSVSVHLFYLFIGRELLRYFIDHGLEGEFLFVIGLFQRGKLFHQSVFLVPSFYQIESISPEKPVYFCFNKCLPY